MEQIDDTSPEIPVQGTESDCSLLDFSFCSAGGFTQPHTMRLLGSLQGQTILVLMDSGASHNFISSSLVSKLKLPTNPTSSYSVRLGEWPTKVHFWMLF